MPLARIGMGVDMEGVPLQERQHALAPEDRLKVEVAERSAIELAALQLLPLPGESRPSRGGFATRIGQTRVEVAYRAETARIDLNAAPKELLSGLFVALGAEKAQADGYADHIIAWRTPILDMAPPPFGERRLNTM